MMVYEIDDPSLIHMPLTDGHHVYRAGTWGNLQELTAPIYRLELTTTDHQDTIMKSKEYVDLGRTDATELEINPYFRKCLIQVPPPDEVWIFRPIYAPQGKDMFKDGKTAHTKQTYDIRPGSIGAVQVFTYANADSVRLIDGAGSPLWTRQNNENLMVHAEPEHCMTSNHVPYFNQIFANPLDLEFTDGIKKATPPQDSKELCISAEEFKSLYELKFSLCPLGADPINCLSGFVDGP